MKKNHHPPSHRRSFLKKAAVLAGSLALPWSTGRFSPKAAAAGVPSKRTTAGYRLTSHIRKYYATAAGTDLSQRKRS